MSLEREKTRTILYVGSTALVAMTMLSGAYRHLTQAPDLVAGIMALGYPLYVIILLGVWKLLGTISILAPGWRRLKEWAYAGMIFDLTGATVSHLAMHSEMRHVIATLLLAGLVLVSWATRPANRML